MKSAIAAGVLGAFWLGVWTAPAVRGANVEKLTSERMATADRVPEARAPETGEATRTERTVEALAVSDEPVQAHAKALLTWGTDPQKAADGFKSAEQFVTVATAARNTEVPFMLLKHRVLVEKQSLADAIRESKPEMDATLEANRARLEARANLARIAD
jgi:hypothetical protein